MIVYLAGVVFGSVGGSLPSPTSYLAGASAGVYALIAAHVSTLIMNWKEDGAVYEGRNKKSKAVSRSLDPLIRFPLPLNLLLFSDNVFFYLELLD